MRMRRSDHTGFLLQIALQMSSSEAFIPGWADQPNCIVEPAGKTAGEEAGLVPGVPQASYRDRASATSRLPNRIAVHVKASKWFLLPGGHERVGDDGAESRRRGGRSFGRSQVLRTIAAPFDTEAAHPGSQRVGIHAEQGRSSPRTFDPAAGTLERETHMTLDDRVEARKVGAIAQVYSRFSRPTVSPPWRGRQTRGQAPSRSRDAGPRRE